MKFSVYLPSKQIICSEITLKHYKDLLKVSYGDEPSHEIFVTTLFEILSKITNESIPYFETLNIYELYMLLLQIRIQSMGDSAKIVVTQEENKQITIDLNLQYIFQDLLEYYNEYGYKKIEAKKLEIIFEAPSLKKLLLGFNADNYISFFKSVSLKDTNEFFAFSNNIEAQMFFDKLPARISSKFLDCYNLYIKTTQKANLLENYNIDNAFLNFAPTIDSFIWFTKLLFNESLESFYNNIFYLSYLGHMQQSYLEDSCTPGEYIYFVKKIQEVVAAKSNKPQDTSNDNAFSGNNDSVPEDLKDG